jgi:NAD(P)-dependent dehydrogenase (short-subunit alcohol dehydrogenase family)
MQTNHNQPLLDGRVAIVTGASRGIGAATARAFVAAGAAVALAARDVAGLAALTPGQRERGFLVKDEGGRGRSAPTLPAVDPIQVW